MNRWLSSERLLIIAHRGASAEAPENTLRAFQLAREQGADGIELDVHLSADNIPVIIHDDTVDRTTNGVGAVADLTVAQLQQLEAGNGEHILTLSEFFEAMGRDLLVNVEIKVYGWRDRGCEKAVADCIQAHNVAEIVTVSSFDLRVLYRARRVLPPETGLAMLRNEQYTFTHRLFRSNIDHPSHILVTPQMMQAAQQRGQRVHVWTVDDPAEGRRLQQLGVNALITNRPKGLRTELDL